MEAIIEVKNLRKSFKVNEVLKGVNFSVRKGQIFCLLGSNGAGKTTTVRILATLTKMDSGQITVCGYDLLNENKIRQSISLTGQYAAVDEMLTGRENMHLVANLRHLENYKSKIKDLLEMFELSKHADKLVKTYSGGMRRKIDLAMSLLGNPQIIFLDEPTTGLDPQSRLALWGIIENLKMQGKTIFLTTQYLEEAERLADYVAILDNGVIVAEGTPKELKNAFSNISVMEYSKDMPTLEDIFLSLIKKTGENE